MKTSALFRKFVRVFTAIVMPDLIRHPVFEPLDSGFSRLTAFSGIRSIGGNRRWRRNDEFRYELVKRGTRNLFILFLVLLISLPQSGWTQENSASNHTMDHSSTLTLEECYRLALIQSETVAIQKEAIARATAQIFSAASQGLGDVDFVINRSMQNREKSNASTSAGGFLGDPNIQENKFTISQPLFQGFKAIGALTGAGSYRQEQKENWIRAKELLYQDVSRAFYAVLLYKKEIEIIRDIHELLGKRIKELEDREKIGRSRKSEVASAHTRIKVLEADLAGDKGSLAAVQYLLEFLIGTEIQGTKLEEDKPQDLYTLSLLDYLKKADQRPDVRAAQQSMKTAWRGILVAQSGFWPTLSLDHNQYMRREGFSASIDWDTLLTFDLPLFSGGETIGLVKDSISVLKQKKLSFSLAKRQATMEIKQDYEGWRFSREQHLALLDAVAAAEENYALQSEEYRQNLVSNLDVLAALESLNQTRQNANQAYYRMKQNEAKLKVAIGEVP